MQVLLSAVERVFLSGLVHRHVVLALKDRTITEEEVLGLRLSTIKKKLLIDSAIRF
jgi:hypothetical protein